MLTARSVTLEVDSDEKSAVHSACEEGDLGRLKTALQEEDRAVNSYYDGYTPLHSAVISGRAHACDVISVLLEHGADINAQTQGEEDTALHLVVERGDFPRDFALVMRLLENNADLSVRNKKLRTAYDCAIGKGHFELASTLDGSMPPEQGHRFYCEKIGEKYGPHITAAVLRSDQAQLEESLRLGGSPNMLNQHGAGAIHYAITHCQLPVMQVLRALLDAGADVNLRDDEGDSGLNLAIKTQRLKDSGELMPVVDLLLQHHADPSFKDLDGKNAFDMAEERGYDDVLEALNRPRQRPKPAPTPREPEPIGPEEVLEPEPEVAESVEEGSEGDGDSIPAFDDDRPEESDPNTPNAAGLYPIHVATFREDPTERSEQIESLLSRGAKINQVTEEEGNTALHLCAEQNLLDSTQQLLSSHIDYTLKNKEGKTAYEVASELGHHDVASAIEAKEKEVREKWKKGKKAGSCAML